MADFYPLILKGVMGLEHNAPETRRALYDRVRTALLTQLRAVEPALSEPDITRERLALEEAIRKVEAEVVRRARDEAAPQPEEPRSDSPEEPSYQPDAEPPSARVAAQPLPRPSQRLQTAAFSEPQESSRAPAPGTEGEARLPGWMLGEAQSRTDKGPDSFGNPVAEPESHDVNPYQAATNAEFRPFEPPLDTGAPNPAQAGDELPRPEMEPARLPADWSPARGAPPLGREPYNDSGRAEQFPPSRYRNEAEPQRSPAYRREREERQDPPRQTARGTAISHWHEEHAGLPPPRDRKEDGYATPSSPLRSVTGAQRRRNRIAALIILVLAGFTATAVSLWKATGIWNGTATAVATLGGTPDTSRPPELAAPDGGFRGKIAERAPTASQSAVEGASLAPKVVMVEEDPNSPDGKPYSGTVRWRTDRLPPGPGQNPEVAVRADVEIPDLNMSMRWSLRRNNDRQLPASHTIEVMFTLPPNFPHGGISEVPGVVMKQGETTRGVPLNGVVVKVTTNFFLIGLSSVDAEMQRNTQFLKERPWFDIFLVYGDGRRAIITMEKGAAGDRAIADAFSAWGR